MRIIFSLKTRRPTGQEYLPVEEYTKTQAYTTAQEYEYVKTLIPDLPWELYKALITASLNGSVYEQPAGHLPVIRNLIRQNEVAFVIRLAIWLRENMNQRSLALLVTAELAVLYRTNEQIGRLADRVLQQAADIPEFVEYFVLANGSGKRKPLNKAGRPLERSLSAVFNRIDEYQFTHYDRDTQLKVKYALSHIRPKAKDKAQRMLYDKILRDKLPARSTWEGERDALQLQHYDSLELKQTAGKDKWKEWISSFRIGYPALLENLQPILTAGVSGKVLKLVAEYLGNGAAVARNRPSPFRILEAYRELQTLEHGGAGMLCEALEQAAIQSAGNLAGFEGDPRLVIAMDVSNSMKRPVREHSLVQRFDIAPLLTMLLQNKGSRVTAGIVGNTWKWIDLQGKRPLAALKQFHSREGEAGYATNGYLVIQDLLKRKQIVDKIMIFSDSQLWYNRPFNQPAGTDIRKLWRQYRQMAPDAKICLFDLSGQGSTRLDIPEENVWLISGWSDRIFDMLVALENSADTLERINDLTL